MLRAEHPKRWRTSRRVLFLHASLVYPSPMNVNTMDLVSPAPISHPSLRRRSFIRCFLLTCITVLLALASTATLYAGGFCAIAYSVSTGRDGWSHSYDTRRGAERRALEECNANDARVVAWYHNGYVALARGDNGAWGCGYGPTRAVAESLALANCPSRHARIERYVYSFD
jgi:hypothetical protein